MKKADREKQRRARAQANWTGRAENYRIQSLPVLQESTFVFARPVDPPPKHKTLADLIFGFLHFEPWRR